MECRETQIFLMIAPSLRNRAFVSDEAVPSATLTARLTLVVSLCILLRPRQLLHPLDLPTTLFLIFLIIEI